MTNSVIRLRSAVCIHQDDRILLVKQARGSQSYWLLPGGGVEPWETLQDAACREVQEETGYNIALERLIIICEAIHSPSRHSINIIFAGTITGGQQHIRSEEGITDVQWHPVDALTDLTMHPPLNSVLEQCYKEGYKGDVRFLGNVWVPMPNQSEG